MTNPIEQSYAMRLAASVIAWRDLRTRAQFEDLASVLGCQHAATSFTGPPAGAEHEQLIRDTWVVLLREQLGLGQPTGFMCWFIMDGLLENDRWRTLLGTESDAHAFAAFIVRFLVGSGLSGSRAVAVDPEDFDTSAAVQKKFRTVLAPWLAPLDLSRPFTLSELARAFFGEAWCTLVMDANPRPVFLYHLIMDERPPFMPGLLTAAEPASEKLPDLD